VPLYTGSSDIPLPSRDTVPVTVTVTVTRGPGLKFVSPFPCPFLSLVQVGH
jgi:hypothetical protein